MIRIKVEDSSLMLKIFENHYKISLKINILEEYVTSIGTTDFIMTKCFEWNLSKLNNIELLEKQV